ncbi:MAG: hypothetical protein RLW87_02760 [Alphaproteobacteria bacterium]|uniref:hypothetical protein n=1 Tax=Pacificispira sp. TaxID=2888761 RepID=UPI0032F93200
MKPAPGETDKPEPTETHQISLWRWAFRVPQLGILGIVVCVVMLSMMFGISEGRLETGAWKPVRVIKDGVASVSYGYWAIFAVFAIWVFLSDLFDLCSGTWRQSGGFLKWLLIGRYRNRLVRAASSWIVSVVSPWHALLHPLVLFATVVLASGWIVLLSWAAYSAAPLLASVKIHAIVDTLPLIDIRPGRHFPPPTYANFDRQMYYLEVLRLATTAGIALLFVGILAQSIFFEKFMDVSSPKIYRPKSAKKFFGMGKMSGLFAISIWVFIFYFLLDGLLIDSETTTSFGRRGGNSRVEVESTSEPLNAGVHFFGLVLLSVCVQGVHFICVMILNTGRRD